MKIEKARSEIVVKAIKNHDFSEVEKINAIAKRNARAVFDAVSSGEVGLIYYDLPAVRTRSGATSFLRYILHRSTKRAGCLQLSCVEMRDDFPIPTSDVQFSADDFGFKEFFKQFPATAGEIKKYN